MRNTVSSGKLRLMIYRGNEGYVGVCYETGMVDVWPTIEETKKHLLDGAIALIESVEKGELSEEVINATPPLKYRLMFRFAPVAFALSRSFDVSVFAQPILPHATMHA